MRTRPLNPELRQIASQIELFLLDRAGWVPDAELITKFGIGERQLRADDMVGRPGLLDEFAISSSAGFKHLSLTTVEERLKSKHRKRRTAIAFFRSIQRQEAATRNCLQGRRPYLVERHTGQVLLGLQEPRPCVHVAAGAAQAA